MVVVIVVQSNNKEHWEYNHLHNLQLTWTKTELQRGDQMKFFVCLDFQEMGVLRNESILANSLLKI